MVLALIGFLAAEAYFNIIENHHINIQFHGDDRFMRENSPWSNQVIPFTPLWNCPSIIARNRSLRHRTDAAAACPRAFHRWLARRTLKTTAASWFRALPLHTQAFTCVGDISRRVHLDWHWGLLGIILKYTPRGRYPSLTRGWRRDFATQHECSVAASQASE
jgi:hypothetical protein